MITLRKSADRGHFDHGWLNTYHTFSFGDYYDPQHERFRSLRVINEDWVHPRGGFGTHPHRDMEIITYVLEGALEHHDSMGNGSVIRPGEVQSMTAGTGITHSERNASADESVHLLQIWIMPDRRGLEPSYQQRELREAPVVDGWQLLGSLLIHQDVNLWSTKLAAGQKVRHASAAGRYGWVQVVRGTLTLNGLEMAAGDGAALSDERTAELTAAAEAEVLLFDLG
jgi:redox-sensitive bicupin YhaK (pirin superfamily)